MFFFVPGRSRSGHVPSWFARRFLWAASPVAPRWCELTRHWSGPRRRYTSSVMGVAHARRRSRNGLTLASSEHHVNEPKLSKRSLVTPRRQNREGECVSEQQPSKDDERVSCVSGCDDPCGKSQDTVVIGVPLGLLALGEFAVEYVRSWRGCGGAREPKLHGPGATTCLLIRARS